MHGAIFIETTDGITTVPIFRRNSSDVVLAPVTASVALPSQDASYFKHQRNIMVNFALPKIFSIYFVVDPSSSNIVSETLIHPITQNTSNLLGAMDLVRFK